LKSVQIKEKMNIKTQILSTTVPSNMPVGSILRNQVLSGEITGLSIECISVKGPYLFTESSPTGLFYLILSLRGDALLYLNGKEFEFKAKTISRIPYNEQVDIHVKRGKEFHFLFLKKQLDDNDLRLISQSPDENSSIYIKALSDCQVYTEEIKSSKTINRMLLPVGLIPRLCIGSVETEGPDSVGEHEHPMLDQLFLGWEKCKCTCIADGESILLTENLMLHIPLGSKHSVSVADGDLLSYIWFDFFFTLKGQNYIEEQHKMDNG
jgi:hypothetical protein